ncbi:efflux transporter outer membrane subunit [Hirschia litorea]|uniref:Efflux transporter outer membrane subunit n=1 Tax=Hirschia litorea TaxID=1199156 RepID=A0ABW2IP37_9PROT
MSKQHSVMIAMTGASLLGGCVSLAPDYDPVAPPVPADLHDIDLKENTAELLQWQSVFTAPQLQSLIDTALTQNRSLRAVAANVRAARAQYGITGSARWPSLAVGGSVREGETFEEDATATAQGTFSDGSALNVGLSSYELDFFGRVANLSEAALQSWLSSVEGERATKILLVSSVADAWISLASNKRLLLLAEETAQSQMSSLELTQRRFNSGVANELDIHRASSSVHTARAEAARLKAVVSQNLNTLRLLVGAPLPEDVLETANLEFAPTTENLPFAQSSSILLNRPDVIAAERTLLAANANIGAARAAFFPSISLTGTIGYASADLNNLVDVTSGGWSLGPSISLPIFDGGRRKSALNVSKAQQEAALANYEYAIQSAFKETADALAVADTIEERLDALNALAEDNQATLDLSNERFSAGIDSYLPVLDAQRNNYSAQQLLIATQRDKALNAVSVFRALGGWPETTINAGS